MKCGLLGRSLRHSYSPQIHAMLGDYSYALFEKEPEEIEDFLKCGDWTGINVTVPYKKTVIGYLDELTPVAQRLGAVNTIIRHHGKLIGHNTDYFGFQTLLDTLPIPICGKKVLVLGSGGTSNTAAAVLRDRGANVVIISRSGENNYHNLYLHSDAVLIVNTTPVGMYPYTGSSPVDITDAALFPYLQGVLDVIYNPARTQLLLDTEAADTRGTRIHRVNGLLMLVAQAKESAQWFTGAAISDDVIGPVLNRLEAQMQNIVLIGMPGCGKTTLGKELAGKTGRPFADADEEIVRLAGKSIPEIFTTEGEESFRTWETKVLAEFGKHSGLIIATGGGCVTKERNYDLLHQNGVIFWIQRSIDSLATQGRPLSQKHSPQELYRLREPMYARFCDRIIHNDRSIDDAVNQIIHEMEG